MSDERKVQEVLARYVRATDRRDGKTQGALFTDEAIVSIQLKTGPDSYEPFGEPLIGGAGVEYAVTNIMSPHPEGGSSHHTTFDHIIDVDGDDAHLNAQFVVYKVQALTRPADGRPAGTFGPQAAIRPVESGYYDTDLRRIDGEWKIVKHTVLMDTPIAVPGA
ncbi:MULTISPECIES: nuclear transport factor 2 family protein [unclassified Streptomyces]|uniref:nuclear transport factor 2 family protein n=1 Tax=unclassified Streptomyces TaxID=2593676 RepID=UPI00081F1185|nr:MULTISPECIES: nuclear transport factor 2 family protein [unclassified Streptomyces]MYZ38564.1 nuclear transport factor 2 family protein [Streptomyces sp. SID4917]SCF99228.1 SnoaL-like domain-containing protein [Streptomyces sp. MnatMP-M17]